MRFKTIHFRPEPAASSVPDANVTASARMAFLSGLMKIVIPTAQFRIQGWYRFKIISPGNNLDRVSFEVVDTEGRQASIFNTRTPQGRFTGYMFFSQRINHATVWLGLPSNRPEGVSVTLRPISLIEYVWHALRLQALHYPKWFMENFYRRTELFDFVLKFPRFERSTAPASSYRWWIKEREPAVIKRHLDAIEVRPQTPTITVLMPVCDPRPSSLAKAIKSVQAQTSPNWFLSIADDASANPEIRQILERAVNDDGRISVSYREQRGGISAATNTAFGKIATPFVTSLNHEDMLAGVAIEATARHLAIHPDCRLLFSDEDNVDENDRRFMPYFKPRKFCPTLFESHNYLNYMTTYHSDTIRSVGKWRTNYDGAQNYDLGLRVVENITRNSIDHLALVLYHVRALSGLNALDSASAIEAGRKALADHMTRRGAAAEVSVDPGGMYYRIRRTIPTPVPKVSIIIPFRNGGDMLRRCVSSILTKTRYDNYELILVDNGSTEQSTLRVMEELKSLSTIRVLHDRRPFNYSQINNTAVQQSDADFVCLLNNDTEVINEEWLQHMMSYAVQPDVGCVGAKLYYPNGSIQHAGVILGIGSVAGHAFLNFLPESVGAYRRLLIASNYSAVTAACLVVRKSLYQLIGGLDEVGLPVTFNDVDLGIKLQKLGYQNIWTPFAELYHHESATRGADNTPPREARLDREIAVMKERHGDYLQNDPCYSEHLTLMNGDYSIRAHGPP